MDDEIERPDISQKEIAERAIKEQNAPLAATLNRLADQFGRYREEQFAAALGKRRLDRATIIGLFITAFFTFVTAIIFYFQLREMRTAVDHADTAAATQHSDTVAALEMAEEANRNARQSSAREAKDTATALEISQRPIVYFLPSAFFRRVNEKGETSIGVSVGMGNSGNLPTSNLEFKMACLQYTKITGDPFAYEAFQALPWGKSSLGPKVVVQPTACEYSSSDMVEIAKFPLYVIAYARYHDRFDDLKFKQTQYCYKLFNIDFRSKEDANISSQAVPCDSGHNCADEECDRN
jgi:hypothetical protein